MASFALNSDGDDGGDVTTDFDIDIPLYGDDGVVLETPSAPSVASIASDDHVHKSGHEGCERCAGKFVYKRKPVRSKPKPSIKPSVKPVKVKRSFVKGRRAKKT